MSELVLRDGERLFFETRGEGPPLLLAHGFTGSGQAWESDLVGALSRDHRAIVPDLLGHGRSSKPGVPARYALEQVIDDLVQVLDACEVERATWVGYSMGGRVALGAAVLRPARVRALVLEGASPGLQDHVERRERVAADEVLARKLETEPLESFVDDWMALPLFASQQCLGPEYLARARARRLSNDPRALAACLRGLGTGTQPALWAALKEVRCPVLLLAGDRDAKFRDLGMRMQAELPDARFAVVADAGHTTHLENPEAWLAQVERFVRGLETSA